MSTPTVAFNAGEGKELADLGDFFRVMSASAPIDVIFYHQGREVSRAEGIGLGYWEEFQNGDRFDRVHVTSQTAQTIQVAMRLGTHVGYDIPPTGNVSIAGGMSGAFTQTAPAVTNASGALLAAKANRRYLLIQNNDPAGDIFVRFDGAAATAANGVKIAAGGSYECQGFCPSGAITAIGSIANNAAVVVVEG